MISLNVNYEIFTIHNLPTTFDFDLGVSYCYPRKILPDELSIPSKGFINYHPAPLPEYQGIDCYSDAIKNQVNSWGVTVHYMDEEYDTGKIIKVNRFDLHESPTTIQELGALSHYFLFQLFKDTLPELLFDN